MNVLVLLGFLLILTVALSKILSFYLSRIEKRKNKPVKKHKIHVMFPCHFALAAIAFLLCIHWFFTGESFLTYGRFWDIVERGTLKALTSVMSIVGIGSILLGWIYSERDKLTLGQTQIDMIHYCCGWGYAGSIVVHFGASAMAILMLECAAKEAALWAFFAVAWGCIPQAWICLAIAMNQEYREKLAVQLWKEDGAVHSNQISVIHRMASYLNETEVRYSSRYREALGTVIKNWLFDQYDQEHISHGVTEEKILTISAFFREFADKVPESERIFFEEEILKNVCDQLGVDSDADTEKKDVAVILLSCGYIRFLYAQETEGQESERVDRYLSRAIYFYHQNNVIFQNCMSFIQDFICALEWFLFLNQKATVPRNANRKSGRKEYIENIFVLLILSIWKDNRTDTEETARISWQQVQAGGEE